MPGTIALVDYRSCEPDRCGDGECPAAAACPRKLLRQEAPLETPMLDPVACRGCGDCVRSCPLSAIKLVRS